MELKRVSTNSAVKIPQKIDQCLSAKNPEIKREANIEPKRQKVRKSGLKSNMPPVNRNGVPIVNNSPRHGNAWDTPAVILFMAVKKRTWSKRK